MEKEDKKNQSKKSRVWLIILIVVLVFIAGGAGTIVGQFYLFPRLAGNPYFSDFVGQDDSGHSIIKMIEKEKEVVVDDDAFVESIDGSKQSLVSVVAKKRGATEDDVVFRSGFIVSADGLVVTSKRNIDLPDSLLKVVLDDGTIYDVVDVAKDPLSDLALLKIDADNLNVANLYPGGSMDLGKSLYALGNTLDANDYYVSDGALTSVYANSVTNLPEEISRLEGVLETSAYIDERNSGGEVININGEVVGMGVSSSGPSSINYVLPVEIINSAIRSYIENDKIVRKSVGIRFGIVTPEIARINNLDIQNGMRLESSGENKPAVTPGGSAAKAGLQAGDTITKVDGQEFSEEFAFMNWLQEQESGQELQINYERNGRDAETKIIVGEIL